MALWRDRFCLFWLQCNCGFLQIQMRCAIDQLKDGRNFKRGYYFPLGPMTKSNILQQQGNDRVECLSTQSVYLIMKLSPDLGMYTFRAYDMIMKLS